MYLFFIEFLVYLGMLVIVEVECEYWLSLQKVVVKVFLEIDVYIFYDVLGLMYLFNWLMSENGEWEMFMLQEMVCGDVIEIYVCYGVRYFWLWDVCNLSYVQIIMCIKEGFNLIEK